MQICQFLQVYATIGCWLHHFWDVAMHMMQCVDVPSFSPRCKEFAQNTSTHWPFTWFSQGAAGSWTYTNECGFTTYRSVCRKHRLVQRLHQISYNTICIIIIITETVMRLHEVGSLQCAAIVFPIKYSEVMRKTGRKLPQEVALWCGFR